MNYFFTKKTMKLIKYITFILLIVVFTSGCNSFKKAVMGGKKENTDEFLIKKKSPLVLPPNFKDLPKPQKENDEVKIDDENIDLSSILDKSKKEKNKILKENNSLEESISEILNSK